MTKHYPARIHMLLASAALALSPAYAATFSVTTTADSGKGSLRQALLDANATPGADTIAFAIPGSGEQRIALKTELPAITDVVTIDGYSQPGAKANSLVDGFDAVIDIFVDGSAIPPNKNTSFTQTYGLTFRNTAAGSRVSGLKLSGFAYGIVMANASSITVDGNKVLDNTTGQILVSGNTNVIGVPGIPGRNLVSGKAEGIVVAGDGNAIKNNYIGFAESIGDKPTANAATNGIKVFFGMIGVYYPSEAVKGDDLVCSTICAKGIPSNNHQVGGVEKGQGNVVIGQGLAGLITQGASNGTRSSATMRVEGNLFGVNFDGKRVAGFGNFYGIYLNHKGASLNIIRSNTIAEGQAGIVVDAGKGNPPITGAKFSANSIVGQSRLAIDLGDDNRDVNDSFDADGGNNNKQNFPVLKGMSPGGGGWTLASAPSESFTLEFFQGANCKNPETEVYLGSYPVTTDASGNAIFTGPLGMFPGGFITATATDKGGNTSEVSDCVAASKLKSSVSITSWKTPLLARDWSARFQMSVGGGGALYNPTGRVDLTWVSQDPAIADRWFGSAALNAGTALWDQLPFGTTPGIWKAKASYAGDSAFDASTSNVADVVVYDVKNACSTGATSDIFRADFTGNQATPGTYQYVSGSDIVAGNIDNWQPLPLAPGKQILAAGKFDGWIWPSLLARDAAGNVTVEFCYNGQFDTYAISGWQPGDVVKVGRFFKSSQQDIVVATGPKRFEARELPDGFTASMPVARTAVLRDESANTAVTSLSIVAVGDFDGDTYDDIIWNVDGRLEMWLMSGTVRKGPAMAIAPPVTLVGGLPVAFSIAGVGDFDLDGRVDIVWRGGNAYYIALMDGASLKSPSSPPVPVGNIPADWKIKAIADYDGDGKSDLLWRYDGPATPGATPGLYVIDYMSGAQVARQSAFKTLLPLATDFIDP